MTPIAHLGTTVSARTTPGVITWLSTHSDLITAAAAFAAIYFLLIRKP